MSIRARLVHSSSRRVASGRLLRQLVLLAGITLAELYVRRRAKRKRKEVKA